MIPKSSGRLPTTTARPSEAEYLGQIRSALRGELGETAAGTKTIMRWTGASVRTARNRMSGAAGPSGYHLICLARGSDAVQFAMLAMSGREEMTLFADIHAAEVALAKAAGALAIFKRQRMANG
jgi:hypothetical protein